MMTQSKPCKSNWIISIYSHYQTLQLIKNQTKRKVVRPNNNKHLLVNWTHDQTKIQNTHTQRYSTNKWMESVKLWLLHIQFNTEWQELTQSLKYPHNPSSANILPYYITCCNKKATEEPTHTYTEDELQALHLPSTLHADTLNTGTCVPFTVCICPPPHSKWLGRGTHTHVLHV